MSDSGASPSFSASGLHLVRVSDTLLFQHLERANHVAIRLHEPFHSSTLAGSSAPSRHPLILGPLTTCLRRAITSARGACALEAMGRPPWVCENGDARTGAGVVIARQHALDSTTTSLGFVVGKRLGTNLDYANCSAHTATCHQFPSVTLACS